MKKKPKLDTWDEEENIYCETWRDEQVDSGGMDPWEAAFMEGWDEAM